MNNPIQKMYPPIAARYERINHLITLGLDIGWRKKLIRLAARHGGQKWADLCTGTGEIAAGLHQQTGAQITGVDFSPEMLDQARQKTEEIEWIEADIDNLPFPDHHFDGLTLSFATRNLNQNRAVLLQRLREIKLILKPGRPLLILETSQPENPLIRFGFHQFIKHFVQPVGNLSSKTRGSYDFLAASMLCFYNAAELAELLREAGFERVKIHPLLLGTAAIHEASE